MLLRWSDNNRGRTVTLELDAHSAEHPFKGLKCGENGTRMQIVAVLVGDDEQPVSAKPTQTPQVGTVTRDAEPVKHKQEERKPYTRSQIAALKIRDPEFQLWLGVPMQMSDTGREESADARLKHRLGINSKRELDTPGPAAEAWDKLETSFRFRDQVRE